MRPELTVRETLVALRRLLPRAARDRGDDRPRRARPTKADDARRRALRRPAAPPRRRRRADRRPRPALPRRADHRLRPLGAPPGLGRDRRPRRGSARPSSSPPTTWTRPSTSPTGSRSSPAGGSSPRAARTSSATARRRPTTISFRLPNGTAAPATCRCGARSGAGPNGELVDRDPGAGRGAQPAHRLGAGALARARRRSRSTGRASRTSTSSSPRTRRRGEGDGDERGRARPPPVPLRPEVVLAQPGGGLLHRRPAADVPLHLRDDLRQRHARGARRPADHDLLRARRSSPWRSSRRPCRASRSGSPSTARTGSSSAAAGRRCRAGSSSPAGSATRS